MQRIRLDTEVGSAVQKHLLVRIEHVLNRLAATHAGKPVEQVTADMLTQLRALGVNVAPSMIVPYARSLSSMPPVDGKAS